MITYVRTPQKDEQAGIAVYSRNICERLQDNAAIDFVHPWHQEVTIMGKTFGGYLSRWAWTFFGKVSGEIVHSPNVFQIHRKTNSMTVHDLEAIDYPEEYGMGAKLWEFFLDKIRNMDCIITPTDYVRDKVLNRFDISPDKVHKIAHGIDHDVFYPESMPKQQVFGEDPFLLMVGEVRPRKKFIETVRNRETFPFNVVRVGPHREGHNRYSELQSAVRYQGSRFFDLGYVDKEKLRQLYSAADAVLHPARNEGFGFVPLEAAACGTPTICRDVPAYRETVGLLRIPLNQSWQDIQKAIDAIPSKELQRKASEFSWRKSVNRHLDVWKETVERLA